MKCLSCGKPLDKNNTTGWHKACIRRFFGTETLPYIDISKNLLETLAIESINMGITVTGVQKKLSLHLLSDESGSRLTLLNYPPGYILKPQVDEFEAMPEAEHLVMAMAASVGIETVPNALLKYEDGYAYITKRVDRVYNSNDVEKLAMEDFCQLDLRLTSDKYKGSYERCGKIIKQHSDRPGIDLTEFFLILVFSFAVGNSDMHLKNFSLIESKLGSGQYILAPAYDLLPVNVLLPEDNEQFALPLNGKKNRIVLRDFYTFAQSMGLSVRVAENLIGKIIAARSNYTSMIEQSFLPQHLKSDFIELLHERISVLTQTV